MAGGWLGGRWEIDRRTALALMLAVAVVALVVGAWALRGRDVGTPVPPTAAEVSGVPSAAAHSTGAPLTASPDALSGALPTSAAGATPAGTPGPAGQLRVQVVGQVRRPGVVTVPAGARVEDAVQAAGGATRRADLAAVNLARPVVDGEQIYLSRPGEKPHTVSGSVGGGAGSAPAAGGSAAPAGPVNQNTATLAELDSLPGVGPVLAQRILQWRQDHGRYTQVDELGEVQGIGDTTLAKLRPLVGV